MSSLARPCSGKSVVNTTLSSSLIISNIQRIRRGQCSRFRVFGNKPNDAHLRRAAIGRGQRAFNHKIPSEWRRQDFNHFMPVRMIQQSRGEFFPRFQFESETAEKFRLVLAVAMRGREKVMCDFPAWNDSLFGIG